MTAWLTRMHLATFRLGEALRVYWKRIAVGAFCGWLLSTVLGAFALVGFESANLITAEDSMLLGAAIVWMSVGVGACVAYVAKPAPTESRGPRR